MLGASPSTERSMETETLIKFEHHPHRGRALAMSIAVGLLESTAMAIPGAIYGLWIYFSCGAAMALDRHMLGGEEPPAPEAPAA